MESDEKRLQFVSDRIEALVREFGAQHDPAIREKAEELVRLLMELYGAGLNRMLEIVDASDNVATESLFDRFASDALISNLLVLHGLHPHNLETRMRRALDRVETAFGQKSGWIQLVEVRDGVAFVRVNAPSRVAGIRGAIDRALSDAAPELSFVDIEADAESAQFGGLLQIS